MKVCKLYKSFLFINILDIITCMPQKAIINKPVVDLRLKPEKSPLTYTPNKIPAPIFHDDNPLQDSQLLLNEQIESLEEDGEWIKILALEQRKYNFDTNSWTYHIGWIKKEDATLVDEFAEYNLVVKTSWAKITDSKTNDSIQVSIGTKLLERTGTENQYIVDLPNGKTGFIDAQNINRLDSKVKISTEQLRQNLIETTKKFWETLYSWGGRSGFNKDAHYQTGVDCSSFVNLVYRVNRIDIPRDAKHQFQACTQINGKELQPGDLIFFAKPNQLNPKKTIHHVMMYNGNKDEIDLIIECTGRLPLCKCRITNSKQLLGKPINEINSGDFGGTNNEHIIYFGKILK